MLSTKNFAASFFILIILMAATQSGRAQTQQLTLLQALDQALKNSPGFEAIQKRLNIAQLQEKIASVYLLPSLDLSSTHGLRDSSPKVNQTPWVSELNLALTENLWDNGQSRSQLEIAKLNRQQAELQFQEQKNKFCLEFASQFLTYSLNLKQSEIQQTQFQLIEKQYKLIAQDYFQGMKTKKDYLRFKTQVSRSEIDLESSKNQLEKSKLELKKLMGIASQNGKDISFVPLNLDGLNPQLPETEIKLENHSQTKIAFLQKQIDQMQSDLIAKKNWPEVGVTAGASYGSSQYVGTNQKFSDNAVTSWNALLTVKYNLIDWGIRSSEKAIANQKREIQVNEIDKALLVLDSELVQLVRDLKQNQKNFGLTRELLKLEKGNIDFIELEYRTGKVQYLDLIAGLNSWSDAQLKFFSAATGLQGSIYTLLYHQGKLYEELVK